MLPLLLGAAIVLGFGDGAVSDPIRSTPIAMGASGSRLLAPSA